MHRPSFSCLLIFFLFLGINVCAQQSVLSVESIMQDPQWMGTFPSQVRWDEQGEYIYFNYNRDQDPEDSLYRISVKSMLLEKINWEEERKLAPSDGVYNADKSKKAFVKNNSLRIYDIKERKEKNLLEMEGRISNLHFLGNNEVLAFRYGNNAYSLELHSGVLRKLTDIKSGEKPAEKKTSAQDAWLKEDNSSLLQVVKEREEKKDSTESVNQLKDGPETYTFYLDKRQLSNLQVSADGNFVALILNTPTPSTSIKVPDFIAADEYKRILKLFDQTLLKY